MIFTYQNCDSDTIEYAVRIDKLNDHQYLLNYISIDNPTHINQHESFRAHSSIVLGEEYFNIRILDTPNDSSRYFFLKKAFHADTLFVSIIKEDDFDIEFESSKNFRNYIQEHQATFDSAFSETHYFLKYEPEY